MEFLKIHSLPLFLATVSLVLALMGEDATLLLRYERSAVGEGEMWRLLSGHLLHTGWAHLWLNLAGLGVVWLLFEYFLTTFLWWTAALLGSAGISLCFFLFMPELTWYVGLSGLLHTLLVVGAVAGVRRGRREFALLLIFVFAKIVYEQLYGPLSSGIVDPEGGIVVNAHLYGVVMGGICMLVFRVFMTAKAGWTGRRAD